MTEALNACSDAEAREGTPLRRELERLRAVEARATAAAEALPDGLAIFDVDDRVVYYNSRYPEHVAPCLRGTLALGKRFGEWVREGLAIAPIYHPDMGEDFSPRRLAVGEAGVAEHEHRLIDGRWLRIRESRTPDGGRVVLSTDVTATRRREEEARILASAIEQVGDPVEIASAEHGFTYVNRAFETTTGWPRALVMGRQPQDVLSSGAHPPEFFQEIRDCLARGESWHGTIVNLHRDGRPIEQDTTISPLRDETGRIAHHVAVKRDVTAARAHARALAQSEARYRALVQTQTEFVVRTDANNRFTFMNDACERYYGKTLAEMNEAHLKDPTWLLPEDQPIYDAHMAELTPNTPTHTAEWRVLLPDDGGVHWEQWTDTGIFDDQGALIEVQCVGREVTDRKEAERAMAEREAQFRTIAESVPVGLIISEIATARPLYINPKARSNLGLAPGAEMSDLFDVWEDPDKRRSVVEAIERDEAIAGVEAALVMPDGRRIIALISATRITWGGRAAMLAVTVDITEQRRTEAMLRESEARLRAFMDFAPVAAHLRDADGRYIMLNREMEKVLGVSADEALGRFPAEVAPHELVSDSAESHRSVIETGMVQMTEAHLAHVTGPYNWALVIRFPVQDAYGVVRASGACVVDISERKATEARLRASEARLAAIIAANPVAMNIARRSDDRLVFVNDHYVRMFGLENVDLDTLDRNQLFADPEDRDWLSGEIGAGRDVTNFELTLRRMNGTEVPVSITLRTIEFEGDPALVTSLVDLSNLRAAEAEIARQREALHQSEKMTALGSLLAGVAHELNNPLSVVLGYSSMLRDLVSDPDTLFRIERVHSAAERCTRIVRSFLAMARSRPPERGPLAIGDVVESALDLAAYGLRSADVLVEVDIDPGLSFIWGDADQLHQVLVNLVVNAQHALINSPTPRRLWVRAWPTADGVIIEVADNGSGMAPDVAKRAFEPFFTTKPQGVGTGVGLSVCHGIIAAHGGSITLETTEGAGAALRIVLPRGSGEAMADPKPAPVAAPASGRVLIVDDEPDIAALLADHLRGEGLIVETATSGRRALRAIRAGRFDAVISDLRMPDMDGAALAAALAVSHPDFAQRLLFITGDALGAGLTPHGIPIADIPVFEKPLNLAALTRELHIKIAGARLE